MSSATPAAFVIGDVDDDDVGQFFLRDGARHRRADVARAADHRDFSIHAILLTKLT